MPTMTAGAAIAGSTIAVLELAEGSEPLKAAHPLPICDSRVVGGQFHPSIVDIVVDHLGSERRTGDILKGVEPDDLMRFGLIPEFIGRLPVLATLEDLDETALVTILTEPKNALVKQYKRLFEMENVELTFTDDALIAVAKKAITRKTGARGLRSILEGILLETMFELPTFEGVEEVVVNAEVIEGKAQPLLIYSETKKKTADGAA